MPNFVVRFVENDSGATAIEYGLILVGIAMVIIAAVNSIGTSLKTDLTASAAAINP